MGHSSYDPVEQGPAWNAGKKLGAKRPLKPKELWEIRFMLDREHRLRDRALFDLAIESKLRGGDLAKVRIGDLISGGRVRHRAMVIQQKAKRPVRCELLEPRIVHFDAETGGARRKHLHDLRGTFASKLILEASRQGKPLTNHEIAELMGWSPDQVDGIRRAYVDQGEIVVAIGDRIRG